MGRPTGETTPPQPLLPVTGARSGLVDGATGALVLALALAVFWAAPNPWASDAPFSVLATGPGDGGAARGAFGVVGVANARIAGALAAGFALLAFLTARLALGRGVSVAVAVVATLGSPVFSTASRALGGAPWALVFTAAVVWLLWRAAIRNSAPQAIAIGVLGALAAFARPGAALDLFGVAAYLAVSHRRVLAAWFAGAAVASLGVLVALARAWRGVAWPGPLHATSANVGDFVMALLAAFVSPGRGVVIGAPALAAAVVLAVLHLRHLRVPSMACLAAALIAARALAIAACADASHPGFGARDWTAVVPWFVLLGVLALDAARATATVTATTTAAAAAAPTPTTESPTGARTQFAAVAGVVCAVSIAINTVGAVSLDAVMWNLSSADDASRPARIWDWQRPQFLAPIAEAAGDFRELPVDGLAMGSDAAAPFLGAGWSRGEGDFRWTDGRAAFVRFSADSELSDEIQIEASPYLPAGAPHGQRLYALMNGHVVWTTTIAIGGFARHALRVPAAWLRAKNTLAFVLPDAVSPRSLRESDDERQLGIAVRSIAWARARPLPDGGLRLGSDDAAPYLRSGWSYAEDDFRWTDGPSATVVFAGETPAPDAIEINLRPYLTTGAGAVTQQRVHATLNGRPVWTAELTSPETVTRLIPIPPGLLRERNHLTFDLPDAMAPASPPPAPGATVSAATAAEAADVRRLALAVHSIGWLRHRSLSGNGVRVGTPDALGFLGAGWSYPEDEIRWTDGDAATVNLGDHDAVPGAIRIELRPFLVPGKIERQRVIVQLNGHAVQSIDLTAPGFTNVVIPLDPDLLVATWNALTLALPNAASPRVLGLSDDGRRLGIAAREIREAITIPNMPMNGAAMSHHLGSGWSDLETDFRWTDGPSAELTFDSDSPTARAIEIDLSPYLVPGKLDKQHVDLALNGRVIWSVDFVTPGFAAHVVPLPPHVLAAHNTLTFRLPDAASPHAVEPPALDMRRLGISVRAVREAGRRTTTTDSGSARRW